MGAILAQLPLFRELILNGHSIYSWCYTPANHLLFTNCPFRDALDAQLRPVLERCVTSAQRERPMVLSQPLGLTWIVDFEGEDYLHVIGPVLYSDLAAKAPRKVMERMKIAPVMRMELESILPRLPLMSHPQFLDYGVMLHYVLTGTRLMRTEFRYGGSDVQQELPDADYVRSISTWTAEQMLMQMIENGNLDYRSNPSYQCIAILGDAGRAKLDDPVKQRQVDAVAIVTLCARAAVRGGVSPDIAVTLNRFYVERVLQCDTLPAVEEVLTAMQDDFVNRVHQIKIQQGISPAVLQVCSYIQLNLNHKLSLKQLAAQVGYSPSYLSAKFKEEMHQTIYQYRLTLRMEHAKKILESTQYNAHEVAKTLGYASASHFGEQFRQYTGQTPGEYIRRKQ